MGHSERISDDRKNEALGQYLLTISGYVKADQRIQDLVAEEAGAMNMLDVLVSENPQSPAQWPEYLKTEGLVHAVASRRAFHEADRLRNEWERPLAEQSRQLQKTIGRSVVVATAERSVIEQTLRRPSQQGSYEYVHQDYSAGGEGVIVYPTIFDPATLMLGTNASWPSVGDIRFFVPLLDPVTHEPQATLAVAE
jgi:hypothetical protein